MEKKLSSYQKMKQKYEKIISEQANDIDILVGEKDNPEYLNVYFKHSIRKDLYNCILRGTRTEVNNIMEGIYPYMSPNIPND